jgi:hypothetical protein
MGRTPRTPVTLEQPEVNTDVVAQDAAAATLLSGHLVEIDATYGDGLPYDRDRLVNETRFLMAQSAEAMLEIGKRLILMKEHEPHGDFTEIVEERLGVSIRSAQIMMQASAKFMSPALASKARALAHLGKTKLYELMLEPESALEALAEGGSVKGMKLDEIDCMTTRELRARLREQADKLEVKDRQLEAKDKKINDLDAELSAKPAPVYDLDAALGALDQQTRAIVASILASQRKAVLDVMGEGSTHDLSRSARQQIGAAMGRIILAVRDVAADLDLDVNESPKQDTDSDDDIWAAVNAEMAAKAGGDHAGHA